MKKFAFLALPFIVACGTEYTEADCEEAIRTCAEDIVDLPDDAISTAIAGSCAIGEAIGSDYFECAVNAFDSCESTEDLVTNTATAAACAISSVF